MYLMTSDLVAYIDFQLEGLGFSAFHSLFLPTVFNSTHTATYPVTMNFSPLTWILLAPISFTLS